MSNVSQLLERLREFQQKLETFDATLEDEFLALSVSWDRLDAAWDGVAYQEFIQSWNDARNMFRHYTSLAYQYEMFLRERVEALQRFERGG